MAVVSRFQSEIPSVFLKAGLTDHPRVEVQSPAEAAYHPHDAEAPDRGFAGETREGRMGEAPDAGEGRSGFVESEFTHGRSQS